MNRDVTICVVVERLLPRFAGVLPVDRPLVEWVVRSVIHELDRLPGALFVAGRDVPNPDDPHGPMIPGDFDPDDLGGSVALVAGLDDWSTASDVADHHPGEFWIRRYVVIDERTRTLPAPAPAQAETLPL